LLEKFWASHHCGAGSGSRQYMHAVFYHNDGQRKLAEAARRKAARSQGIAEVEVKTAIVPVGRFTYAEAYHQKYALTRSSEVRKFLEEIYPSAKELADSTVATRLNAYLGSGYERNVAVLEKQIAGYGLPEKLAARVLEEARRRQRR
jgi:hypothetical protein